jgi:hypothetical protein
VANAENSGAGALNLDEVNQFHAPNQCENAKKCTILSPIIQQVAISYKSVTDASERRFCRIYYTNKAVILGQSWFRGHFAPKSRLNKLWSC